MKYKAPTPTEVSLHEAAHAVAACRLLGGVKVIAMGHSKATRKLTPTHTAAGHVMFRRYFNHHMRHDKIARKDMARVGEHGARQIVVCVAGPIAHAMATKRRYTSDIIQDYGAVDFEQARHVAAHLTGGRVYAQAMNGAVIRNRFFQPHLIVTDEAQRLIRWAERYARQLVRDDWHLIEAVAKKLRAKGKLGGDDRLFRNIERITDKLTGVA